MTFNLERMLRERQDQLRGRPEDWRDHMKYRLETIDWAGVAFMACVIGAGVLYVLSMMLKLIVEH